MDNTFYTTCDVKPNETVSTDNSVPHNLRANVVTRMPTPPINGGLYGGEQVCHPWMPQPVIPTDTNMIMNNLKSANPPPGALSQFVSTIREGNNYVSMPTVYNYSQTHPFNCGPYNIRGTK
jgi:hypothetical protein